MLFHRQKHIPWPLIFFGCLAAGIVIATGMLVLQLSLHARAPRFSESKSPSSVVAEYQKELAAVLAFVESNDNSALPDEALVRLLELRVPRELMADHLSAVREVSKKASVEDVRAAVRSLARSADTL